MWLKVKEEQDESTPVIVYEGEWFKVWITCRLLFVLKDELKGTIRLSISGGWKKTPSKWLLNWSKKQIKHQSCFYSWHKMYIMHSMPLIKKNDLNAALWF